MTTKMIYTESGSVYELKESELLIRRLSGNAAPTDRQGNDGEFKSYKGILYLQVGVPLIIIWRIEDSIAKSTVTSPIIKIQEM